METLESLRADLNVLRDERDAMLGLIAGLYKVTAALIQTHPDHDAFHLAMHRLIDAQELGLVRSLANGPTTRKCEEQVIESLLTLKSAPPSKWTPPA